MDKFNLFMMVILAHLLVIAFTMGFKEQPVIKNPPIITQLEPVEKLSFIPPISTEIPTVPEKPAFSPSVMGIIEAGKKYPGAKVCFSESHPILMALASNHCQYMARTGIQGHQGFNKRFQELQKIGLMGAAEICAESWPWEANEPMYKLGWGMFKSWRTSNGHWRTASAKHRYFGADMAKGSNGIWYACIIVAD